MFEAAQLPIKQNYFDSNASLKIQINDKCFNNRKIPKLVLKCYLYQREGTLKILTIILPGRFRTGMDH